MNFIFVYITNPTEKDAKELAARLLKKRLIACANIFPIASMYWGARRILDEKEFVLIAKTSKANFEKVKSEVQKVHSYIIPCIIKIPVSSNREYFKWLMDEMK